MLITYIDRFWPHKYKVAQPGTKTQGLCCPIPGLYPGHAADGSIQFMTAVALCEFFSQLDIPDSNAASS